MGRKQKVTCSQVMETVEDREHIIIDELADMYKVCPATIRTRLRELRNTGEPIFFDQKGLFILDNIKNKKQADQFKKYTLWVVKTLRGLITTGKPAIKLQMEWKRSLKEIMDKKERMILTSNLTMMTRLLDYISIEDEMEE